MNRLLRASRKSFRTHSTTSWIVLSIVTGALVCVGLWSNSSIRKVRAASPSSGKIAATGPVLPFMGTWIGDAAGGSSPNGESTCVEGTNCDSFRLTVQPGDYTGKQIAVKLTWTVPADDYDLYIHKCPAQSSTNDQCNAAAATAESAGGAPSTEEDASIDPGGVLATWSRRPIPRKRQCGEQVDRDALGHIRIRRHHL